RRDPRASDPRNAGTGRTLRPARVPPLLAGRTPRLGRVGLGEPRDPHRPGCGPDEADTRRVGRSDADALRAAEGGGAVPDAGSVVPRADRPGSRARAGERHANGPDPRIRSWSYRRRRVPEPAD